MNHEDVALWKDPLNRTDHSNSVGNPVGEIELANILGGLQAGTLEGGTYGCCPTGTASHVSVGCCPGTGPVAS